MNIAYNMDCMDYMRTLPDKAFDLAVVDPPYFSGPERQRYYGRVESRTLVRRREYHVSDKWQVPGPAYFDELLRVSKKYIVWGCNYFNYVFAPGRIVWDKCNGSSTFSDCEIAATNCHDSVRLFRYMWNGMMQGKSIDDGATQQGNKALNENRIHPTQKPIALYTWIFSRYADSGDKVLDTHLGSGSSRIAAREAGLSFVGCELDPVYFRLEEERYGEYAAQENLFLGR